MCYMLCSVNSYICSIYDAVLHFDILIFSNSFLSACLTEVLDETTTADGEVHALLWQRATSFRVHPDSSQRRVFVIHQALKRDE